MLRSLGVTSGGWARWFVIGLSTACFSDPGSPSSGDADDSGGDGSTSTGTNPVSDDSTVSTSSTSVTTATTMDESSSGETTIAPPTCDDTIADPPEELCARPSWSVELDGDVTTMRKAVIDGEADDLVVTYGRPNGNLAWIFGGDSPGYDTIAGVVVPTRLVVDAIDDEPGDDVILLVESPSAPDLSAFTWSGGEYEFAGQAEPAKGQPFTAATGATLDATQRIAWLAGDTVALVPFPALTDAEEVVTPTTKTHDLARGRHGDVPLLFVCKGDGFETAPFAAGGPAFADVTLDAGGILCAVVDIDGDGNTDFVHLRGDDRTLTSVIAGTVMNEFQEVGMAPLDALPVDIASGDFDHDEDVDFAIIEAGLDHIRIIWTGEGAVPQVGPRLQLDDPPTALAAGDFDGDGDADIAYALGNEVRVLAIGDE
jgi:hypothetical protein